MPPKKKHMETKKLGNCTGKNIKPRKPDDTDYGDSWLRILPFDHAFAFIRKNIEESKLWFNVQIWISWYMFYVIHYFSMKSVSTGEFYNPERDAIIPKDKYNDGEIFAMIIYVSIDFSL